MHIFQSKGELVHDYKKIIYETEQQRKGLYQFAGFYGLRPYLTHLYKPLDEETVRVKSEKQIIHTFKSLHRPLKLINIPEETGTISRSHHFI